jgi:hypothetical protein
MALDRDMSILTQVAFKGAIEVFRDSDLTDPEMQAAFASTFSFLTSALFDAVAVAAPIATAAPQPAPAADPAALIHQAFPGTTETNAIVTVKGQQHGPLPQWLIEQAAAKGVFEVWDNRNTANAQNKRPWFKATSGDVAFWPPRG